MAGTRPARTTDDLPAPLGPDHGQEARARPGLREALEKATEELDAAEEVARVRFAEWPQALVRVARVGRSGRRNDGTRRASSEGRQVLGIDLGCRGLRLSGKLGQPLVRR